MTKRQKIQALVDEMGVSRTEARAMLVDMGDIDLDDTEDDLAFEDAVSSLMDALSP